MKTVLRFLLIALMTAGLLWLWLHGLDLEQTAGALTASRGDLVLLAVVAGFLHLPLRAYRWGVILGTEHVRPPGLRELLACTSIGYLVTFLIPGRLGEVVRPGLLARRNSEVPLGGALASIVFERILDTVTLLFLMLLFIAAAPSLLDPEVRDGLLVACAAVLALGALGVALHRLQRRRLDALVRALAARVPGRFEARVRQLGLAFLAGFDALWQPGSWWRLPLLSLLVWSTPTLLFAACIPAVHVEVIPAAPLFMVGVSALGIAIPTPAGVGGFHQLVTWGLSSALGGPPEASAAVAVLAHLSSVVPILLIGLYFFWREGLSVRSLKASTVAPSSEEMST